jgi:aromatic-L-amino-acid/L-tryptophan decarboxylase
MAGNDLESHRNGGGGLEKGSAFHHNAVFLIHVSQEDNPKRGLSKARFQDHGCAGRTAMNTDTSHHMTPDAFRRYGHDLIEWIAQYQERVAALPVASPLRPGEIRAMLPMAAPERGEPFDRMLEDVERIIMPGLTHWQSPHFHGYFPANNSGPSILGELLAAGLGVQGMLWSTSPACTELESHVLDWLVALMGLPDSFRSDSAGGGVIQDSASSAVLCALLAARERATGYASNTQGLKGGLMAYASNQAHSSVEKAVGIAGLGRENLRLIEVDERFALRPDSLAEAIARDRADGKVPCFVVATVGTTSTLAMDPIRAVGKICRTEGLWLHVDAAMAGAAAVCPEHRQMQEGLELADSYCFNPHKWMFTNFDCDCFYVADRAALIRTLSILPEYLKNQATESGAVIDYRDWQVPLGRRFRALKLWFVIRHYGAEGLRQHLRQHIALARELAEWMEADPRFEVVVPPSLNLVCFRLRDGDDATERLLTRLNESGRLFLTHTRLGGRHVLRLCIGQTHTSKAQVREAWECIRAMADQGGLEASAEPGGCD